MLLHPVHSSINGVQDMIDFRRTIGIELANNESSACKLGNGSTSENTGPTDNVEASAILVRIWYVAKMGAKGAIGIVFIMQCHLYSGEVYWEVRLCSSRPLTQYITCMCSMLGELLQPFSHYHNTRNNVHANCHALFYLMIWKSLCWDQTISTAQCFPMLQNEIHKTFHITDGPIH